MPTSDDDLKRLLEEIRDLQREQLAEYRRVTEHSLALQQDAVDRQAQFARVYRSVIIAGIILVIGIVLLIVYLLSLL